MKRRILPSESFDKTIVLIAALAAAIFLSCGSKKTVQVDFNNVPDNERCAYMKEVCKEAYGFQSQYERMNKEEKEDARAILNAYIQQCEGAQELCKKSQ